MDQELGSEYVYDDEIRIGQGTANDVFRGTVRKTGAPVAVKVLKREYFFDREAFARVHREYTILQEIRHPNVVEVIDFVVDRKVAGIVMELIDGRDLSEYLSRRGTLPPELAARFGSELFAGMAAAHSKNIVHRDIKPANVLVCNVNGYESVKLIDFGIARLQDSTLTRVSSGALGTPAYMAPELARGNVASEATDMYSAGIVLYEMLAGCTPYPGLPPGQRNGAPPLIPGVPAELWQQIELLLATQPKRRRSAAEVAAEFEDLVPKLYRRPATSSTGSPIPTSSPPLGRTASSPPPGHRTVLANDPFPIADPLQGTLEEGRRLPRFGNPFAGAPAIVSSLPVLQRLPRVPWPRTRRGLLALAAAAALAVILTIVALVALPSAAPPVRSYLYNAIAICSPQGAYCSLNEHTGPGYTTRVVGKLPHDSPVRIVCQTAGESVQNIYTYPIESSDVWDKLVNGDYITDVFVSTGHWNNQFTPPIPRC